MMQEDFKRMMAEAMADLEQAAVTAEAVPLESLLAAKLVAHELTEMFREAKSKFSGLEKRLDLALCQRMADAGEDRADFGGHRFYADMRGFFGVQAGVDYPPNFKTVTPDADKIKEFCELQLASGRPLPAWAREYIEPIVKIRKIKG